MSKKRFSEEQIIYALKQAEGGRPVREVCRELGVSEPSFYAWRKKYGGMGVSELRELRHESGREREAVPDPHVDGHLHPRVPCATGGSEHCWLRRRGGP
jgi:putative transposase